MSMTENPGKKFCPKCKTEKSISEFHKDPTKPDGYNSSCRQCKRAYRISPFYRERERELERTPEWKARKKRYFQTDKGKFQMSREDHRYRTRNNKNPGAKHTLTYLEWQYILLKQENKCAVCGVSFDSDIKPVRDCMVPLSKGGFLTLGNAQALCFRCNTVKNSKVYCGFGNKWRMEFIS